MIPVAMTMKDFNDDVFLASLVLYALMMLKMMIVTFSSFHPQGIQWHRYCINPYDL